MRYSLRGLGTMLLLALAYALDTEGLFPYLAASVLLHELGHVLALRLTGGRIRGIAPASLGLTLRYGALLSYGRDAAVAFGGPAANLAAALLAMGLAGRLPEAPGLSLFAGVNLMLGVFHLLPARPLDGGGVLRALLARRMEIDRADRIVTRMSRIVGLVLTGAGVYILVKTRYNMSILAVGSLILGGTYAAGTGKDPSSRAQARPLLRRRVRAGDQR